MTEISPTAEPATQPGGTVPGGDIYRRSRLLYIAEAALEYFIAILVGEAYLAKVATAVGFSNALTGILTAFTALGTACQLTALFIPRGKPVKRWVTWLHLLNQLFFACVYFVPSLHVPFAVRAVFFIGFLLAGHVLNNVVNASKINWFMSLVDDKKRGTFTANKEIVSLIGGMIFSFGMGRLIDTFEAAGRQDTAFLLAGGTILILTLLHTATLVFSREKPPVTTVEKTPALRALLHDQKLRVLIGASMLWNVANYAITPFLGTYKNEELGFSMTFIALLTVGYSVVRSLFSRPLGRFADRTSFPRMLSVCLVVQMAALGILCFTVPVNGRVLYPVFYLLNGIAMAGINSGAINLIYSYVRRDMRTPALALKNSVAGITGFLTTLVCALPVSAIQNNGNTVFGIPMYAQQFLAGCSLILVVILFVYLNTAVRNMPPATEDSPAA